MSSLTEKAKQYRRVKLSSNETIILIIHHEKVKIGEFLLNLDKFEFEMLGKKFKSITIKTTILE